MRAPLATLLVLALLAPTASRAAPASKRPKVVLLELRATSVDRREVAGLAPLIASEIGKPPFRVITGQDVEAVVGYEKQKELLGCNDAQCFAQIGGALGVDYLVAPEVSSVGGVYLLSVSVLDSRTGQSLSRTTRRVPSTAGLAGLVDAAPAAVAEAMEPIRQRLAKAAAAAAPEGATAQASAPPRPAWRTLGYVADGVGGAALLGGVVFDVLAARSNKDSKRLATGDPADRPAFDDANSAFRWQRATSLSLYVAGGAVLATGLVLSLWPEAGPPAQVAFVPSRDGAALAIAGGW